MCSRSPSVRAGFSTWVVLLAAALASVSAPPAGAAAAPGTTAAKSAAKFESAVVRKVNRVRAAHDLHRVRASDCLDGLAEPWASHLAAIESLVHRDQAIVIARCSLSWAGEDLGSGSELTARKIVRAWMDSPEHRKVLLKPRARRIAVAAAPDSDGVTYVVANMGDPR